MRVLGYDTAFLPLNLAELLIFRLQSAHLSGSLKPFGSGIITGILESLIREVIRPGGIIHFSGG